MAMRWLGGDGIRRDMAVREFQAAGLSSKAAEALVEVGTLSLRDLLDSPWSDDEAGRKFVSTRWRLSVSPNASSRVLTHVEAFRSRLLQERGAA